MNDNMNSPAQPCETLRYKTHGAPDACNHPGLSKREYAAIHLGVPDSGDPELDRMIRESLRDELAG